MPNFPLMLYLQQLHPQNCPSWNLQVERAKVWDNLIINLDFVEGRNCASAAYFWASYTWLMAAILQSHTLCQMMIAAHSPNLWPKNGRRGNTYKLCFADWDILQTIFNLFLLTNQFWIHLMAQLVIPKFKHECTNFYLTLCFVSLVPLKITP